MTNYPFEMQLVVDPTNPRNVVAGGSVSIYDSADTGKTTLLPLTDPNGVPIANPITSNANGFTEPFVTTSPQVLWVSGEYVDYFNSYVGMRNEALAAKTASESAAANAGAAAVADLDTRIASGVFKGEKGSDGSNVLPTDTAVKDAIANPASLTRGELNATFASQLKVTAFGTGVGTGNVATDTAAAQAAMDAAAASGKAVVFPAGASYNVNTLTANSGAHIIIEAGAEVVCNGDTYGITSTGTPEASTRSITAGATAGSSSITLANVTGLAVNDWIMITSEDSISGTAQKRGMLRRVTVIAGSVVTIDGPMYMALTSAVAIKIVLAPQLVIEGGGRIRGATPATQTKGLIRVLYGIDPVVSDITIGPGGGPGLQVDNCVGGWSTAHFVDLMDDAATNHYGYAVNWGGATRGHVIRGGSATRVRHGVTTNALNGTIAGLTGARGEPEACIAGPGYIVSESINAGLDTHEAGQGVMLLGSVHNCSIGMQDRATNTVLSGTVQGADLYGFHITSTAVNPLLISPKVLAMGTKAGAAAFRISAACTLDSPYYPVATAGVPSVNATADYTVRGGGYLAGSTTGVGVQKVGMLGAASVTRSGTADIKQTLVDLGLMTTGSATLTTGLSSVVATGTSQSRLFRVVATAAADIPLRVDGASGATGNLAEYRVNGASKTLILPNGDVEVLTNGGGFITKSPDGTRYRIAVANGGTVTATAL